MSNKTTAYGTLTQQPEQPVSIPPTSALGARRGSPVPVPFPNPDTQGLGAYSTESFKASLQRPRKFNAPHQVQAPKVTLKLTRHGKLNVLTVRKPKWMTNNECLDFAVQLNMTLAELYEHLQAAEVVLVPCLTDGILMSRRARIAKQAK